MPKIDAHLFICTNKRDSGESCGAKNSAELRDRLKEWGKDPAKNFGKRLRVNNAGCLGLCEKGIVCVLYPEGRWFTDLKSTDDKVLQEAVEKILNVEAGSS